jgi:hypothetical protein
MNRTFSIINHRVGKGGAHAGPDVKRVKQLLRLAGYNGHHKRPRVNPKHMTWDRPTQEALIDFRTNQLPPPQIAEALGSVDQPDEPFLDPHSPVLFDLALKAGVLIRLAPGVRAEHAFKGVHRWCEENCKGFSMEHVVWPLKYSPAYAIVTTEGDRNHHFFDMEEPRALNCTLYVNLMMSVWLQGHVSDRPYSADVSKSGNDHHLAHERYKYPLSKSRKTLDEVKAATKNDRFSLFCLEPGENVSHMALLLNGQVFECSPSHTPNCRHTSLDSWMQNRRNVWVSGPSPT